MATKKCGACKAFVCGGCDLRYQFKPIYKFDILVDGIPIDKCPKPLTTKAYANLLISKNFGRN